MGSNDPLNDTAETDLSTSSGGTKKFIKLDVPDFDTSTSGSSAEPQRSYLRIGATEAADPVEAWQEELVQRNGESNEDFAARQTANESAKETEATFGEDLAAMVEGFYDDDRTRTGSDWEFGDGSTSDRQAESARLHTKGGWRDHTDGNRITTTRGDKVEVIGGNYKMLILGRTDMENFKGHEIDSSGGLVRDIDQTAYAVSEITWTEDGNWKVTTEGSVGDYHGNTTGDHDETHNGELKSTHNGKAISYHYGDTDDHVHGTTYWAADTHVNHHELTAWVDHQDLTAGVSKVSLEAIAQSFSLLVGIFNASIEIVASKSDVLLALDYQDIHLGISKVEMTSGNLTTVEGTRAEFSGGTQAASLLLSFL